MTQQQELKSVVTEEMKALVGKENPPTTLEVEKTNCRMFARSVGHTDPIFYDEDAAKAQGYRSIVAPPGFMGTPIFNPAASGGRGRGFSTPYKRVLNAGTEYEYLDTICAGDVLTSVTKISGFTERVGGIGPMLITSQETTYTNQDGKVVAKMYGSHIQY